MRKFASDRSYLWLLRHMKGESPAQIAKSDKVQTGTVRAALSGLGVGTRRWNLRYMDAVIPPEARHAYSTQRVKARERGISWGFTLETWWATWRDSGKWLERGKDGYVMARTGDVGPYAPANVRIATMGDNLREASEISEQGKLLLARIRNGECRVVPT